MPELKDIEEFKSFLNSLGDEPEILEKRGRSIEEVLPPEEGIPSNISNLFSVDEDQGQDSDLPPGLAQEEFLSDQDPIAEQSETEKFLSSLDKVGQILEEEDRSSPEPTSQDAFSLEGLEELTLDTNEDLPSSSGEGGEEGEESRGAFGSETAETPESFGMEEGGESPPFSGKFDTEAFDSGGDEDPPLREVEEEPPLEGPASAEEFDPFDSGSSEEVGDGGPDSGEVPMEPSPPEEGPEDSQESSADTEKSEGEEAEDDEDFDISDFSLGDLGEQFGIKEEGDEAAPDPSLFEVGEDAAEEESAGEDFSETGSDREDMGKEEFFLDDAAFLRVQEHLEKLPRNLKLIIEEQIGEKGLIGKSLETVLEALARGARPKELAAILEQITGEPIVVPDQYEKLMGEDFEGQRGTFAYIFRNNVLPLLRFFLLGAAALGILSFFIFRYVYTPLYANTLYRAGIVEIQEDNYRGGNEYFNRAAAKWRVKRWYYTYAEQFVEKRQYPLGEEKYEQLLAVPKYRGDTKGLLDYARLESETLGKYSEAEELLKRIFSENPYQKEALLLAGDNYLRWGDEIDPGQWEEARYHYALLMQRYGLKPVYLFRMLRYLIRMDRYPEIIQIKEALQGNPRAEIEAKGYAELAEYLLNRGEHDEVLGLLNRAREADPLLPEVYYQMSRYFHRLKEVNRENLALRTTLELLQGEEPASRKRLEMLILAHNRIGEILYGQRAFLDAEAEYRTAIERYEEGRAFRRLSPRGEFGKIYANMGDLYYYAAGDYNIALDFFLKGEENLYVSPDIQYRKGFIYYRRGDYRDALGEFYMAGKKYFEDPNLLYATASTLYMRNDFFSAQGYYNKLIEEMEQKRDSIQILLINEEPDHRALIENLMIAHNNLGVTLNRLYLATGDPQKNADSLVQLTRSSEYFDYLTRDPETMQRSKSINLAHINMKNLLYPLTDYQLQIYRELPKDRQAAAFRYTQ